MKHQLRTAIVRVPATTSNLGPGFDTLGIALRLYNSVRVTLTGTNNIRVRNVQMTESAGDEARMPAEAVEAFSDATGRRVCGVEIQITGNIPMSRGFGSSVTIRLGIIAALNALHGRPLDTNEVLALVTSLEGHPDNAAPALWGGFVAAGVIGGDVRFVRIPVPPHFKFVTAVPDLEIRTEQARRVLPAKVSLCNAVSNLQRTALITAAFAHGKIEWLQGLFDDTLHQPYREKLVAALPDVIKAGVEAGAVGGWLSGSGSSIICLTRHNEGRIAAAMKRAFLRRRVECKTIVLTADNTGLKMKLH